MAVFNLFMGTARKSVGDITLYREGGRQIARVRVRNIANPKSEGQSIQRNYVAPVSKFYGALADILARSYEGLNKSDSYNEFQRTNIRLARANGWFLDKFTPFYPLPYQLSRGVIVPMKYHLEEDLGTFSAMFDLPTYLSGYSTLGDWSNGLIKQGYKTGDVVSVIIISLDANGQFIPDTYQFRINPLDTTQLANLPFISVQASTIDDGVQFMARSNYQVAACASIVARPSKRGWLRSTQFLAVRDDIVSKLTSAEQRASAIASYEKNDSSSGGEVYPGGDGEAYNIASMTGRALLFYGGQFNAKTIQQGQGWWVLLKPANLDDYFYVRRPSGYFLENLDSADISPGNFEFAVALGSSPSDDVTIMCAEGSDMERYLQSIGVPL